MKYPKLTILLLASFLSVNSFGFEIVEITDTTASFAWVDDVMDMDDEYYVCINDSSNCTYAGNNTQNYTVTGLSANTLYTAWLEERTNSYESDELDVKTTHTWDGDLQKCVNKILGHGDNNDTHSPTKAELESLDASFVCERKTITQMDAVSDLKNITLLDLSTNRIAGDIPIEIMNLTHLTHLELSFNRLTGEIPEQIGFLSNLTKLELSNNRLTGEIPAAVFSLTGLRYLGLDYNRLTGGIPKEIGALISLNSLYLQDNYLTGPIPKEIGTLTGLRELHFAYNELTGSIPKEIGTLVNLEFFALYNNHLTGAIPKEIGLLTSITELYLDENKLSGAIPDEIVDLLSIDTNYLKLKDNCNLYSNTPEVQTYIDDKAYGGYLHVLNTNSHDCFNPASLIPVTTMILE
jgi:Leucine-rich repeat (LRR) protein